MEEEACKKVDLMLARIKKLIEDDSNPYSSKRQISSRLIENAAFQRREFLNKKIIFSFLLIICQFVSRSFTLFLALRRRSSSKAA